MPGLHGLVRDVLGNHGLAQALGGDQNDVAYLGKKVQSKRGFYIAAFDTLGPCPIEIGHWFEAADMATSETTFQTPAGAIRRLEFVDILQELNVAEPPLGCPRDQIVQLLRYTAQTNGVQLFS